MSSTERKNGENDSKVESTAELEVIQNLQFSRERQLGSDVFELRLLRAL